MTTSPRSQRRGPLAAVPVDATDEALLAAIADGDDMAFRAFADRHGRRVVGLAYAIVRDRGAAEDVSQRTFERAWRHAASFDVRRGSAPTWLLTITRRLAIDEVRRRRPAPVPPDHLAFVLRADQGADTERSGLAAVQREAARDALAALPEEQRRAVVLAVIGGLSASEVALAESIPLGTAKTRVRLGLRRLRASLASEVDHG